MWNKKEQRGLVGLLQLRSMYQASLPYWYFQMVWPMEQTREMASRQPNSTRIWKLVIRSTLDSFRGGRVEFWVTHDERVAVNKSVNDGDVLSVCSENNSMNHLLRKLNICNKLLRGTKCLVR